MAWSQAARDAAAAAHSKGVQSVGQPWQHYDKNGASLQQGDHVQDVANPGNSGFITRTYFEGGGSSGTPLVDYTPNGKSPMAGVSATRSPSALVRSDTQTPEYREAVRDDALRIRNGQFGSGMKFRG